MSKKINDLPTTTIRKFWKHLISRHSEELRHGLAKPEGVRWHYLDGLPIVISLTTGIDFVRIFVRGEENADHTTVMKILSPRADEMQTALGAPLSGGEKGRFFSRRFEVDMMNEANWDKAADWLWDRSSDYEAALIATVGRRSRP
jgi:hypothetical protein